MRQVCVVVFMLVATASLARDAGIRCEAERHNEREDSLVVVCPPPSAFSPIRIRMEVGQIDQFGWEDVDLKKPAPVEVLQAKPTTGVSVRLPHQDGTHRWLAWRKFGRITTFSVSEERNVTPHQGKRD